MARKATPFILALFSLGLCWLYVQQSRHTVSSLRSEPTAVEWAGQREEVKDAFISSWDAYEAHAWGTSAYASLQG